MKVPDELFMRVKLNLGSGFTNEKLIPIADWDRSRIQVEPAGLGGFALGAADALGATAIDGFSGAASASGFGFIGPVTVTARGSVAFEQNDSYMTLRLEDIDGDGGPDHVIKVNGNAQVFARLNKGSKANLLRRVVRPLGGSFELDYRREGNRIDSYDGSGTRTHQLTADGDTIYPSQYLTLRNGQLPTKHIFAGGARIASKVEPPGPGPASSTFWYHPDHLQSTHFVSDPEQDLVQHDEYFASGEVWVEETGTPAVQPHYLFNGRELDDATGLYYYGARYYDPRANQWINPDPILSSYLGGAPNEGVFQPRHLGLYTYTLNNPVALRDPSGLVERDLFSDTRTAPRSVPAASASR